MSRIQKTNRRKFLRLKAYHLVKYRVLSGEQPPPGYLFAAIQDISAGGVCLRTEERISRDATLELKINFPVFSSPLCTLAKVVWVKQVGKGRFFELGTLFVDIQESISKIIDKEVQFVQDKLSRKKGILGFFKRKE